MSNTIEGTIIAICTSEKKGTAKACRTMAVFLAGFGIEGDAHGGSWHRQVSLISEEKIQAFNEKGAGVKHGAFGENLVVKGIDFSSLPIGTRLSIGPVRLKITQIGKECHNHCAIYERLGDCIMPREGVFAIVEKGGIVRPGDKMVVEPLSTSLSSALFKNEPRLPRYKAAILTASDGVSAGKREDLSGPLIREMLPDTLFELVSYQILPDDRDMLAEELLRLCDEVEADLVLTTGGTGLSPRDCTPEATLDIADRLVPGIAEAMRQHSLTFTKRAMLSRGVAVIRGKSLIINLPGSPKAVRENLAYILSELPHALDVLSGKTDGSPVH